MQKDNLFYIEHIKECILKIETYTHDVTLEQFLKDPMVQDAVIRNFEIIGEATKKLPDVFKNNYPQIPWKKIAGMRDKLIHDYMGVDLEAVWAVVTDILQEFRDQIDFIIRNEC